MSSSRGEGAARQGPIIARRKREQGTCEHVEAAPPSPEGMYMCRTSRPEGNLLAMVQRLEREEVKFIMKEDIINKSG